MLADGIMITQNSYSYNFFLFFLLPTLVGVVFNRPGEAGTHLKTAMSVNIVKLFEA